MNEDEMREAIDLLYKEISKINIGVSWYRQTINDLMYDVKVANSKVYELQEDNTKLREELAAKDIVILQRR